MQFPPIDSDNARVAIICDHPVTAYALKRLIKENTPLSLAMHLTAATVCREVFHERPVDLIVLEVHAATQREQTLVRHLRAWAPGARLLVMYAASEAGSARALVEAGADSLWTEHSSLSVLLKVMLKTLAGVRWVDPICDGQSIDEACAGSEGALAPFAARRPESTAQTTPLSHREREILALIQQGYSNQQIAAHLYLSVNTVKNHMSRILMKLSATNRTQAVLKAMSSGMDRVASI
ncbi:response regulator transcription factor [Gloeobacter kilaueensis]|uniref:Two-component response regulator n=1 Tax=Gloeobacter kilaueensis (strain ATCC BAA-2537 / CCAP 1431/1 / ULC 316 / JS1) TaxID=1183438 RepID=U5QK54_GLOK1|nr:response regulator transcription factor [Gloeobacter kilaueensis]AGY58060.1 two-component response regulator [Gloeobacter kilaueensis JS1]